NILGMVLYPIFYIFFLVEMEHYFSILYYSPLLIFTLFFYLDSKNSFYAPFKSIKNSIKMIFYTYPFCFISWYSIAVINIFLFIGVKILSTMVMTVLQYDNDIIPYLLANLSTNLLIPFFLCFMNNLYTKFVHSYYDNYA